MRRSSTGDNVNTNIAGRSLTLTAGSPDTLDADPELYTHTKCTTIENPLSTDDIIVFRAETALTITAIDCIVGAATSAQMTLNECDGNAGTCSAIEAVITCAVTNTTEASAIDNASIDAGDWIRIDVGTVTGTVGQLAVCFSFTCND